MTAGNSEMPQHIHVVYVRGGTQTQEKHGKAEGGSHIRLNLKLCIEARSES